MGIFVPKTEKSLLISMNAPERTTAEVFPRYIGGEALADSATLKWSGLFARRYRFPRVVDGFLVPATAEALIKNVTSAAHGCLGKSGAETSS